MRARPSRSPKTIGQANYAVKGKIPWRMPEARNHRTVAALGRANHGRLAQAGVCVCNTAKRGLLPSANSTHLGIGGALCGYSNGSDAGHSMGNSIPASAAL